MGAQQYDLCSGVRGLGNLPGNKLQLWHRLPHHRWNHRYHLAFQCGHGFSNSQWAELDLSASAYVNSVTITWGTPYAISFQIQYWPTTNWPPPLSDNSSNKWVTIGTYAGSGGTQGVVFTGVTAQYFRILMTASSGGVTGAYSIAEAVLYNSGIQVSVNGPGTNPVTQTQVEVSSTDPASYMNYTTNPPGSTRISSPS